MFVVVFESDQEHREKGRERTQDGKLKMNEGEIEGREEKGGEKTVVP
jgi:hypothetical protein